MLSLSRYSFGVGDRFAHQARAQLRAFVLASEQNVDLVPVWNKSNREHTFIGTEPSSVLHAAQKAVKELDWKKPWHIDADHINLDTVERFLAPSDFFTIDVAHFIGQPATPVDVDAFVSRHPEFGASESVRKTAHKYLVAVKAAGEIYRHIASRKGESNFITEVSMDETDAPQ
ncbi:MAG TPA: tagaturonate epimerase family protein, partial [Bryobacteraceae bacterium]